MQKLDHANTVSLVTTIDATRHLHLIMEYVSGNSLHHYIKRRKNRRIDEPSARRIFRQILAGIKYCHENDIAHRDIKLENILINEENKVKIIDYGFSTIMPVDRKAKIFCGTPSYMAPEIVGRREYLGHKADIWALGVLLFVMLAGLFPFKGVNDRELYRKIGRGVFHFPDCISAQARTLIKRMIVVDPGKRMSAAEILEDPWTIADINPMTVAKTVFSSCPSPTNLASSRSTGRIESVDINIVADMTKMGYS
jgi:MAP/microtubule affinity-regulating kinase